MRISSALVALVGATAGVATGVTTYQSSAEVTSLPDHDDSPVLAVGRPLPPPPAQVKRVLADCVAPAVLQDGACVTTVYDAVPAEAPEPERQPRPATGPSPEAAAPAPVVPAAPVAPAPAAVPAQWSGAAGSLAVLCTDSAITLQAASPADGYAVDVKESGPEVVEVEFESDDLETEVMAACTAGTAQFHEASDD